MRQIPVTDPRVAVALNELRRKLAKAKDIGLVLSGVDVLLLMAGLGLCSPADFEAAVQAAKEPAAVTLAPPPSWPTTMDATPRAHHDQTVHRIWGTEPRPIPLTEDAWGDWRPAAQEFEPYRLPPFLAATLRGDAAPAHDWSTTIFSALVIAGAVAVLIYLHAQ